MPSQDEAVCQMGVRQIHSGERLGEGQMTVIRSPSSGEFVWFGLGHSWSS